MNWYRIKTSFIGLKRLATLSKEDKQACIDAFKFLQRMQAGEKTETADETKAVADYYKVLNNMLSIFDLEKLYIPPQLDDSLGLYGNQLLCERAVLEELELKDPVNAHLLDMGCGRGRISHYLATLSGCQVSGYNIDPNQIENAIAWAAECGMSDRLHFKVGDHHKPLEYDDASFDGCVSFQAVWPFFKKEELDAHAREMYRVMKPGARYACSEYLLTPTFRLEQRGTRDAAQSVSSDPGRDSLDVPSGRLCGRWNERASKFSCRRRPRVKPGRCASRSAT